MSWFEVGMLICFAASWPVSIRYTWLKKLGKEKSVGFSVLVAVGYVCGVIHKLLYNLDVVILLYIMNLLLVLADLTLVFYFRFKQNIQSKANKQ
jgi:hypothetical protein